MQSGSRRGTPTGVPSLATAPSISGPQYSPQPRDFGDHEKAEGPPRGERRKLPITLSRQAKTQKSWLSIPGRPPLRSTPALVPWCDYMRRIPSNPGMYIVLASFPLVGLVLRGVLFHSQDHSRMLPAHTSPPLQPAECSDGSDQPGKLNKFLQRDRNDHSKHYSALSGCGGCIRCSGWVGGVLQCMSAAFTP